MQQASTRENKEKAIGWWLLFMAIVGLLALFLLWGGSTLAATLPVDSGNMNMPAGSEACTIGHTGHGTSMPSGSGYNSGFYLGGCPDAEDLSGGLTGGWTAAFYRETAAGSTTGSPSVGGGFALDDTSSTTSGGYWFVTGEVTSEWDTTYDGPLRTSQGNPSEYPAGSHSRACLVVYDGGNDGTRWTTLSNWVSIGSATPTFPVVWKCWDWYWTTMPWEQGVHILVPEVGSNVDTPVEISGTWDHTASSVLAIQRWCKTHDYGLAEQVNATSTAILYYGTVPVSPQDWAFTANLDAGPWDCSVYLLGYSGTVLVSSATSSFSVREGVMTGSAAAAAQIRGMINLLSNAFPMNWVLAPAETLTGWTYASSTPTVLDATMTADGPPLSFTLSAWVEEGAESVSSWAATSREWSGMLLWLTFGLSIIRLIWVF